MLVVGMLSGKISLMNEVCGALRDEFGPLFHEYGDIPWNYTDYYRKELGDRVFRRFCFFRRLIPPDRIAEIKRFTNRLEEDHARVGKEGPLRRINLDPGYIDSSKVVLATTKDYSHRIYLGRGIFAETTLICIGGRFRPLPHTYPDYRLTEVLGAFNRMRKELAFLRKPERKENPHP